MLARTQVWRIFVKQALQPFTRFLAVERFARIGETLKAGGAEIELATPVVEIEWAAADVLPFPLALSAVVPNAACQYVQGICVARGNVGSRGRCVRRAWRVAP